MNYTIQHYNQVKESFEQDIFCNYKILHSKHNGLYIYVYMYIYIYIIDSFR